MIPTRQENPEVLYAIGNRCAVGASDVAELKRLAALNPRRRCRICFHSDPDAALHEMLIVHEKGSWVPPHKHLGKDESIHVVEGSALLVSFTEEGEIAATVQLGQGGVFFCRLPSGVFHTLLIESDWLVFQETTLGPFDRRQTVFAPWAPVEDGPPAKLFAEHLRSKL